MRRLLFILILLGSNEAAARPHLAIYGNEVLSDYTYRAVAALDDFDVATPELAGLVERRVQRYLESAGYELARVAVRVRRGGLELAVDEGRLERIVFPGQDALRALGMQFALDLPSNVFNRQAVEEQIPKLEKRFGVEITSFEVREVEVDPDQGLALNKLTRLDEFLRLPDPSRYQLYVFATREALPKGFDFEAQFQDPDGLRAWVLYRWANTFMKDDRLELFPEVGLRLQDVFQDGEGRRFLSRAGLSVRWLSRGLGRAELRPFVWPRVLFISRQRRDLGIRRYDFIEAEPTLGVRIPIIPQLEFRLVTGLQYRNLLGLLENENPLPRANPVDEARALFEADLQLRFGLSELRIARRHHIDLSARLLSTFSERELFHGRAIYRKSFGIGYDDLRIRLDAETLFGTVVFTDEIRVGDHLRGLFGDAFFTSRIATLRLEYAFSIVREVFKLGVFHDGSVFEGVERETGATFTRFANSFGPGAHTVIFDAFRLSLYGAIGFMSNGGPTEGGVFVEVDQLF
ncbi:MAG: hypothetical protein AAGD10_20775 [Myxococcota bacterium]